MIVGLSDYAEIVEDEGDYSSPDGKYSLCFHGNQSVKNNVLLLSILSVNYCVKSKFDAHFQSYFMISFNYLYSINAVSPNN